jgi:molybdopterin biosynthesis enzyme
MVEKSQTPQRIARLTPLQEVLARIDALVAPVAARETDVRAAYGRTLAENAVAASARPESALALRDGWAVSAELIADAGSYAPVMLTAPPVRVDVGDALPARTDAVAALENVVVDNDRYEAIAPVTPGEGVLLPGSDAQPEVPLREAGTRLRRTDIAAFIAAGIERVKIREPRIQVVAGRYRRNDVLETAVTLIATSAGADGGWIRVENTPAGASNDLEAALTDGNADAVVAIGGTGSGQGDGSVDMLARIGRLEVHGIALTPGETAAFGMVGKRPVLLLPGRIDAALAVWLLVGRHILTRLAGGDNHEPCMTGRLTRKVSSTLGLAELVPLRCRGGMAEPLASSYLPLQALTQADGWVLVPPESEGFPEGADVVVRLLP